MSLAERGSDAYSDLFGCSDEVPRGDREKLESLLQGSGMLSVARCRPHEVNIPWSVLYRLPLINESGKRATYCGKARANEAMLDNPEACRSQPGCPLGAAPRHTVCPLGFLGVSLEIEQPLGLASSRPEIDVRAELVREAGRDMNVLRVTEPVKLFAGYHCDLGGFIGWFCRRLGDSIEVRHGDSVPMIREEIETGDRPIHHLFCHGVEKDHVFSLLFRASGEDDERIKVSHFPAMPADEPRDRLVFLSCCDGLAATPESINGFVSLFRRHGALGVVGTEIQVKNRFAARFTADVLAHLIGGDGIVAAFRKERRALMRTMNPLGFAYTPLAMGGLHLHQERGCRACHRQAAESTHPIELFPSPT